VATTLVHSFQKTSAQPMNFRAKHGGFQRAAKSASLIRQFEVFFA
jgi:hypothetical protein